MISRSDSMQRRADWLERTALSASLVCMVHCLALPLLFAALPALAWLVPIPETFHVWMVVIAMPMSMIALVTGRARHRVGVPLGLGIAGLMLLLAGVWAGGASGWETVLTVTGSLALSSAHIANWRLRHAVA